MLGTDQQKRLRQLLREARKKEPHEDVRLVAGIVGVAFVRNRDRDNGAKNKSLYPWPLPPDRR